jgi:kinesin family protein 6/9
MTQVLKDSLGGNCCTSMIATVNGQQEQLEESISTCRFAQRVAMVQNEVRLLVALLCV